MLSFLHSTCHMHASFFVVVFYVCSVHDMLAVYLTFHVIQVIAALNVHPVRRPVVMMVTVICYHNIPLFSLGPIDHEMFQKFFHVTWYVQELVFQGNK